MRDPLRPRRCRPRSASFLGFIVLWPIIAVIMALSYGIAALIQRLAGN